MQDDVGDSCCLQSLLRLIESDLLDVEGIHTARGTDLLSEEQCVVSVSRCGVDRGVPGMK